VIAQLKRHPLAMVGQGCKLVSWYVGNWFGVDQEWERPEEASVEVQAATRLVKAN